MLKITFSGSCRNCFTWYLFRWPVSLSAGLHSQVVNFRDGLNLETKKEKKKTKTQFSQSSNYLSPAVLISFCSGFRKGLILFPIVKHNDGLVAPCF